MVSEGGSQRAEDRGWRSEGRNKRIGGMRINSAKDLNVYKKAYELSMEIFKLSRSWPFDEKYPF